MHMKLIDKRMKNIHIKKGSVYEKKLMMKKIVALELSLFSSYLHAFH